MAQAFHGRKGKVKAGTHPVGSLTAWSYEEQVDEAETTACGDVAKTFLGGLRDGSGQVEAWWLKSDVGQEALLTAFAAGTTVHLELLPTGDAVTGDATFAGDVIVKQMSLDGSKDDIIKISFSFRGFMAKAIAA